MHTSHTRALRTSRLVKHSPIYYGWIILVVGSLGTIMTSPGQTYAISVFIDHFIADLSISRSLVSTLYTAGTLAASFALPFVGRMLDRRGPRLMIAIISLLLGATCIYMGFVRNAVMLGLGFLGLRMLGQGSLSLISNNAINQWWIRRRGLVMGIAGMSTTLIGSGGFPGLIAWLIPQYGWRATYMLLGLLLLLLMFPIGLIFLRNRPEEYGLAPDGVVDHAATDRSETGNPQANVRTDGVNNARSEDRPLEVNWTLAEALRTPVFWLVASGIASMSMLGTGLTFHLFSIFADSGLSASVAASVFLPIAATAAIVQLAGGIMIDRIPARVMLALSLLLQAVTLVMAPALTSLPMAYSFGLLMGVRGGIERIVSNVIWAKYYGRAYLGSISGVVSTLLVASSALGPMPFGIARDLMGSYTTVLSGFALLPLLLAVATLLFVSTPEKQSHTTT